jgi:hypothetical protein
MRIAYFINQYPKVSHTFIRREILALEGLGHSVDRYALRGWSDKMADDADRAEQLKTHYVLQGGVVGLVVPLLHALFSAPLRFARTAALALRLSRQSERSWAYHLIYLAEAAAGQIPVGLNRMPVIGPQSPAFPS